ncbi:hypothetical protein [Myroides odoratus]|uniref:hypothetical protein n=1 Tax=Myroides odoratus TaxID=256 RepID=UPI000765E2E1|nr:hypothetical protein [Myroides odoratus]
MTWYDENETEEEYLNRTDTASTFGVGLLRLLGVLFVIALKFAIIFGLFVLSAYSISKKLVGQEATSFQIWGSTLLITYLLFCFIYFLKGIVIGFRLKRSMLWILPWVVCVLFCCVAPAYIVKTLVLSQFHPSNREELWSVILSWGAFVISLLYIYNMYQFKTPNAPYILRWAFYLGVKVSCYQKVTFEQ